MIDEFADAVIRKLQEEKQKNQAYTKFCDLVPQNDTRYYLKLFRSQNQVSRIVNTLVHEVLKSNSDIKEYLNRSNYSAAVAVLYTQSGSHDQQQHQDNTTPPEREFLTILFNYQDIMQDNKIQPLGPSTAINRQNKQPKNQVSKPNPKTNTEYGAAFNGVQKHWGVGTQEGRVSIMLTITTQPKSDKNFDENNSSQYHKLKSYEYPMFTSNEILKLISPNPTHDRTERAAKRGADERSTTQGDTYNNKDDQSKEKVPKLEYFVHI